MWSSVLTSFSFLNINAAIYKNNFCGWQIYLGVLIMYLAIY